MKIDSYLEGNMKKREPSSTQDDLKTIKKKADEFTRQLLRLDDSEKKELAPNCIQAHKTTLQLIALKPITKELEVARNLSWEVILLMARILEDESQSWEAARSLYELHMENKGLDLPSYFEKKEKEFKIAADYYGTYDKARREFLSASMAAMNCQFNISFEERQSLFLQAERLLEKPFNQDQPVDILDGFYHAWGDFLFKQTPRQIEGAGKCFEKGEKLGGKECLCSYTAYLRQISKDPTNDPTLLPWYRKIAKEKNIPSHSLLVAAEYLAISFCSSPEDQKEGVRLLKSRETLSLQDKIILAKCFMLGRGTEKDLDKAEEILKPITDEKKGDAIHCDAYNMLAAILIKKQNPLFIKMMQYSASYDDPAAQLSLADYHESGFCVEASMVIAEDFLIKAAKKLNLAKIKLLAFLTRYQKNEKIEELKRENFFEMIQESAYIIRSKSYAKGELKKSSDELSNKINNILNDLAKNKDLFIFDKIRGLFFNIRFFNARFSESDNTEKLVASVFKIGKLFKKVNYAANGIIHQYVTEVNVLLKRLADKAPAFRACDIALVLDGVSKLHLNSTEKSIQHPIILLLNYAREKMSLFTAKDLSMIFGALVRLGLPWSVFMEYFPNFLKNIQNRWAEFAYETLIHFAYISAVLDVNQPSNETRLMSKRYLAQLFERIEQKILVENKELSQRSGSQLDLALRYFSQYYNDSKSTIPSLHPLLDYFEKNPMPVPRGNISGFQFRVTHFIRNFFTSEIWLEVEINGLRVDVLADDTVININGPHHFLHSIDEKEELVKTPAHQFHHALLCREHKVIDIDYNQWQKLKTDEDRQDFLQAQGLIRPSQSSQTLMPPKPAVPPRPGGKTGVSVSSIRR
jgi:TPR repeat protein